MRKPMIIVLLALAVSGCAQSQSVGFTGIGSEATGAQGSGFGTGGVTSGFGFAGFATTPETGRETRRLARSLQGVYGAPEVERFRADLAGETVLLRRVDLGGAPYVVLTGPGGAGGVSALAEQTFRVNALSLTNCRQAGPFLSDPVRGSAAPLAC
ncbi:MAG: hypothetical protein EP307_09575 [Rhodobacteraceae bacterium]|nr:MAG: hypothetical protein EP307_09575 [Paracoccaceae bacterium]